LTVYVVIGQYDAPDHRDRLGRRSTPSKGALGSPNELNRLPSRTLGTDQT
jgi:hypothetical protein